MSGKPPAKAVSRYRSLPEMIGNIAFTCAGPASAAVSNWLIPR